MRNKVIIGSHMRFLTGLQKMLFSATAVFVLACSLAAQTAENAAVAPPATQPTASAPAAQAAAAEPKSSDAKQADPNDSDQDPVATIKTQVREVNVIFTVTDKHGRFKRDLKKE